MLNGKGGSASSVTQCTNSPCLQPAASSHSVDVSAIIIRTMTIIPQINAITFNGRVIVIVSIVVVGAIADGDGCRMLFNQEEIGGRLAFVLSEQH